MSTTISEITETTDSAAITAYSARLDIMVKLLNRAGYDE